MAQEMILKLNEAGMTSLHKAGLAGLYMTLQSFAENEEEIEGMEWQLGETEIKLNWTDETPKAAFEKLIKKSFWIDDEGFIRLAGLEPEKEMSFEQRHLLYNSLLNSFLQFGPHRPTENKKILKYEIDDKIIWLKEFAPIKKIRQHDASGDFLDKTGNFNPDINVAGWLYPGGGQRHVAHKVTTLNEPLNLALLLFFAPVGVIYYLLKSKAKGRKARLALLIPEIKNLQIYSEMRQVIASQGVIDLTASSSTDAALRMLVALETNSTSNQFAKQMRDNFLCRIITFGIVGWNEKQKSRTAARTIVSGNLKGFENYQLANTIFKNKWQQVKEKRDRKGELKEPEHFFVTTFCAREMIADNIANGKTWYHNITEFLANRETREQLYYERKEIGEMVEKANYETENESLFIKVCHESWRRRLGKLGTRARTENTSFQNLVRKEAEKLRTSYARCKNAETLRETVVDFWSRGGANELLQGDGLLQVLPLFSEKNWRKAKDLALLALVSYQPQTEEEKEALNIEINLEGENK
jgi:CRISPR-associated protein Cas8a1/Csx13